VARDNNAPKSGSFISKNLWANIARQRKIINKIADVCTTVLAHPRHAQKKKIAAA